MRELSDREILPHPASRQPRKWRFAGGSRVRGTLAPTPACSDLTPIRICQSILVDMRAFARLMGDCETICYPHSSQARRGEEEGLDGDDR
jgi:hypothetical protein